MKSEEILKAAVEKADKNGYGLQEKLEKVDNQVINVSNIKLREQYYKIVADEPHALIFDHDFAKAFFGEEDLNQGHFPKKTSWKYHLQQMVISEAPLKYLEQYL